MGRSTVDITYRIRTVAWFKAVTQASGGMTSGQLEVLFGASRASRKYTPGARPGLWNKYETGYICPKYKPDINGCPSIVERVEKTFPGTAKWIAMPFWDVLSYKRFSMEELREIFISLDPAVRDLIVMDAVEEGRMFWRRTTDSNRLYDALLGIGNLDAATAILGLIKEAEITQNQSQHQAGLNCWASWSRKLQHPILSPLLKHINLIIVDRFTRISYSEDGSYYCLTRQLVQSVLSGNVHPFSNRFNAGERL